MILIGLGGNIDSPVGPPRQTCVEALARLEHAGVGIRGRSPWYQTAPIPVSDQPWFTNAVAELETDRSPQDLLELLHVVEQGLQRVRGAPNGARTLDLDLLAYRGLVRGTDVSPPILPHPRLHQRAFVLFPLCDLVPGWRHPVLGVTAAELARRLPSGQQAGRLPGS
jgi:2-amino-4-hydroxy-6-hydroxymethyldihydropteridine diphosphokinase